MPNVCISEFDGLVVMCCSWWQNPGRYAHC